MNHINKALLTAALGSGLLALEACRKWDTNRLAGRWIYVKGDLFVGSNGSIIFEFEKDGDYSEERTLPVSFGYYGYTYETNTNEGEWEWAPGKKLKIELDFDYDLEFEVILIQGNDMELEDDDGRELIFRKEGK